MRTCSICTSYLGALIWLMLISGCATQSLKLTVTRPAEINLKGFDKIAIGDIVDRDGQVSQHSRDISDKLTTALFESKRFEVLDRQHLGTLLQEHNLTASGLVDEKTAAELGKFIGTAIFVFGRIQADKYEEGIEKDQPWTGKDGSYHQTYRRRGQYSLIVHVSVVDLKTSKVLAMKDIPAMVNASTSADRAEPEKINTSALYTQCIDNVTAYFLRMIAPYQVTVVAKFLTDGKVPEFQQAIAYFKADDWESGLSQLETVTARDDLPSALKAKAFYNMGLAQMYSGMNDVAIESLKKAVSLDPKSMYTGALAQAKKEQEIADKLKQQQQ